MNSVRSYIKKTSWEYLVNRPETLLFQSITDASPRNFRELTNIAWRPSAALRFSTGEFYLASGDIAAFRRTLERGGLPMLRRFRRELVRRVGALDRLGLRLSRMNVNKLSTSKLRGLARTFIQTSLDAQAFFIPTPIAGTALETLILREMQRGSEVDRRRWLHDLVYPADYNTHVLEERAFLRMVLAIKRNPAVRTRLVKRHLLTYGWIGARWFQWWNAWAARDLKRRLRGWKHRNVRTIKRALSDNVAAWRQLKRTADATARLLHITPRSQLGQTIAITREFVYRRAWRTDVIYRAAYRAQLLLREVARRAGIRNYDVLWMTYQEFLTLTATGNSPVGNDEIRERKKFHVTLCSNDRYHVLTDDPWLRSYTRKLSRIDSSGIIKGVSVFPGVTSGTVRVVRSVSDLGRVNRGDILIAIMTFPHFIAAMEKAAAFVTDEGGILCHAAIVAREMHKPCIVGTKHATQILKDGDLVEVDANKGIVRKL